MKPSEFAEAVRQWAGDETKIIIRNSSFSNDNPLAAPLAFCVIPAHEYGRRVFFLTNPGACSSKKLAGDDLVATCHAHAMHMTVWLALFARLNSIPFRQNEIEYFDMAGV